MKYKKSTMKIMDICISDSGINITEEMVNNSITTFKDKPIVLNLKQKINDYRCLDIDKINQQNTIGLIEEVEIKGAEVLAEVLWYNEKHIKEKYDNWQIKFNDDRNAFEFIAVEVF